MGWTHVSASPSFLLSKCTGMGVLDSDFPCLCEHKQLEILGSSCGEGGDDSYLVCLLQCLHYTCLWMPNKPCSEISLILLSFLVSSAFGETTIISWNIWRVTLNHRKPMQKKLSKTNYLCLRYISVWEKKKQKTETKWSDCWVLQALYTKMLSFLSFLT